MSHKFLTLGGWTNLISRGEYVAVPRKESSLQQKKCPIKPELLAWAIGEGSFVLTNAKTRAGRLTITQKSVAVLARLKGMIADTVPGKATVTVSQPKNRCARVSIANKGLIKLFEDNGLKWGLRSAERYIPSCLLKAPESDIVLFLKAYCDAEGFVDSTRGCLEYTTASRMLADQLRVLLRRVGIFSKLRIVKKAATNTKNRTKRNYYVVGIGD